MTNEARVARHKKVIEQIHEDVEWMKETEFRFEPGPDGQPGVTTEELISEQKRIIETYERLIARLQETD